MSAGRELDVVRLFRLGLGTRIFFGFGILVALLLAVATSGSYGLAVVGSELGKMDTIAGSLRRVQDITFQVEVIRRGLTRYRLDADEDSMHDVMDAEKQAVALLEEAAKLSVSQQKDALYKSIAYKLRSLTQKRERFMTLLHTAVQERKVLTTIGNTMMVKAAALADVAGASKSAADWVPGAAIRTAFLSTTASSSRFLASGRA